MDDVARRSFATERISFFTTNSGSVDSTNEPTRKTHGNHPGDSPAARCVALLAFFRPYLPSATIGTSVPRGNTSWNTTTPPDFKVLGGRDPLKIPKNTHQPKKSIAMAKKKTSPNQTMNSSRHAVRPFLEVEETLMPICKNSSENVRRSERVERKGREKGPDSHPIRSGRTESNKGIQAGGG